VSAKKTAPNSGRRTIDVDRGIPAAPPAVKDVVLLNGEVGSANDIWTKSEFTSLCMHLHNANGSNRFVMAFNKCGCRQFVKSKNVPVERAIDWAWKSICGKTKTKMAFAPYSSNNCKQSRWGALDFDAHDGLPADWDRARTFALAAFRQLLNGQLFVILEKTGGGWHVWAVDKEFRPVNWWVRLLKGVARSIGATIRQGLCEIFPPDSCETECGLAVRAPGSWHPLTDKPGEIVFQNLEKCVFPRNSEGQLHDKERSSFLSEAGVPYGWLKWRGQFGITKGSTRNQQLTGLIAEAFRQVGHDMGRRLAETQFSEKAVATKATLAEHMESFEALWRGMAKTWLADIPVPERSRYNQLTIEHERDVFRIVWGYCRKAQHDGAPDFAIAVEDLGKRLGLTWQGASKIRQRLADRGFIQCTVPFQRNIHAARYRWLEALQ
jgi:hypothetical protein